MYLKREYFENQANRIIFDEINLYFSKYNSRPTKEALLLCLSKNEIVTRSNDSFKIEIVKTTADSFKEYPDSQNLDFLLKESESWAQERAINLSLLTCYEIAQGNHKTLTTNAIPGILQDALAVSFNQSIGHNYFEDSQERFNSYQNDNDESNKKLRFDIDILNTITKGGVRPKTLNVIMGGPGVGKSLWLCHLAASYLLQSKNVLYITLEMAEEYVGERIDFNLFNMNSDSVEKLTSEQYLTFIERIKNKTKGKLFIKEYPTSTAHAGHFRALIHELKIKKGFNPDVLIIDYINICASAKIKQVSSDGSYARVKSIAEEIRALGQEFSIPVWSATQVNREGWGNSDVDMNNVSESWGIAASVDLLFALTTNEDLEARKQIMVKQLKNRYVKKLNYQKFFVGMDLDRMKLYNLEESEMTMPGIVSEKNKKIESVKDFVFSDD